MNINRYNYEEFFLLYVDRELNATDRKAVEQFVAENPDLKNELDALTDAVLVPETAVRFPDKEDLLSHLQINEENCEQYFILYADNELTDLEKARVEKFVYSNPKHQESFELYQEIKFDADHSVVYPAKEAPLKKGGDVRVIPLWFKYSASVAAAVIFVVFGYLQFQNETEPANAPLISKYTATDSGSLITFKTPVIKVPEPQKGSLVQPGSLNTEVEADADPVSKVKPPAAEDRRETPAKSPSLPADQFTLQPATTEDLAPVADLHTETPTVRKPDQLQPMLQTNAPVVAVTIEEQELIEEDQSEVQIANFAVSQKSGLGRMIRRTSRFLNKTAKITPAKPGLVIGNLEIAIR